VKDDSAGDLAAFGAPAEIVSQLEAKAGDGSCEVWGENAETFGMFLKLQTQWNVVQGGFIGLNYQSVEFLVKIHNISDPASFMDELQAMEMAALSVLNKRKD
jgi:hypothetical protein